MSLNLVINYLTLFSLICLYVLPLFTFSTPVETPQKAKHPKNRSLSLSIPPLKNDYPQKHSESASNAAISKQ
jgi:hypothetical protein